MALGWVFFRKRKGTFKKRREYVSVCKLGNELWSQFKKKKKEGFKTTRFVCYGN